jgi:hypothetical protein
LTKQELVELIVAQGLEVPGPLEWDPNAGVYRKKAEKKQVYVEFCKRQLFEAEPKPLVRTGKRLRVREAYCLVDVFKVVARHLSTRRQWGGGASCVLCVLIFFKRKKQLFLSCVRNSKR